MARIALVHDIAGVAAIQADLLRGAGHSVDQIPLPTFGASWRWPAKGVALPIRLASYLPTVRRLRGGGYDVIHIHWLTHGLIGVLARRPFFAQAHGSDVHLNLNNLVYRWVTRSVLKRAKKVFYVTPNLRAYLAEFEPKLLYLPNPVDLTATTGGLAPPTRVAQVLIFTRLDPIKGVELIFPAVERLSKTVEITALDWGSGAREYVPSFGDWVRFVKPIPHHEVGAFLGRFDVVIGQMSQGILSLMEIEALAAGRPLVTAIDWSLYPDDPPPVIAAFGPDEIVAAVEKLRDAPDALGELSRKGREWVLRNHGFAHHLKLLEEAYFS